MCRMPFDRFLWYRHHDYTLYIKTKENNRKKGFCNTLTLIMLLNTNTH